LCIIYVVFAAFRKDQAGLSQEKLQERNASTDEEFIQLQQQENFSSESFISKI